MRTLLASIKTAHPVLVVPLFSPPPPMAALLRSAAAGVKAASAAARRIRRVRHLPSWPRQILLVALLTTLVTTLLIWDVPNPLSSSAAFGPDVTVTTTTTTTTDRLSVVVDDPLISASPPTPLPPPSSPLLSPSTDPSPNTTTTTTTLEAETETNRPQKDPSPIPTNTSTTVDTDRPRRKQRGGRKRCNRRRCRPVPPPPPPPPPPVISDPSVPLSKERAFWRMQPHDALMYAKQQIEIAPVVTDDLELYAPLFRNMSTFKRSYELMERILKVYIYPDGDWPIFHNPELIGIYASEGWFMKLMEGNRKFVVQDPSKAHLFYLPYSARQLQLALYVPGSHNMRPLSLFLRDYVNTLSSKYPFWNQTGGADHFLVACHDWGSYTTTEHPQLCKTAIKALCNADVSEGIFVRGKDVSLPETAIRNPKKPLRFVGGKPVSKRSILAFFAGNVHGRVRPVLLKYWDGKDEDMRIYGPLPDNVARTMSYIDHMKASKFCLCPMGFEVNSPRIVEAIYYECVPVIIADNFVLPFDEVLDWSAFSVVVAEKDIPNLKDILMKISIRKYMTLHTNVVKLQKHFLWHEKPLRYDIFHMILHSIWFNRLNQIQAQD